MLALHWSCFGNNIIQTLSQSWPVTSFPESQDRISVVQASLSNYFPWRSSGRDSPPVCHLNLHLGRVGFKWQGGRCLCVRCEVRDWKYRLFIVRHLTLAQTYVLDLFSFKYSSLPRLDISIYSNKTRGLQLWRGYQLIILINLYQPVIFSR